MARDAASGIAPGPLGARHPSITPFAACTCSDRPIVIVAGNDLLFDTLAVALVLPELLTDARFASNAARTEHVEALATATAAHWLAWLEAAGLPCALLNDVAQALAHPQVIARNIAITTALPASPLLAAGNPVKLSGYADPVVRAKAPALDEHRAEIWQELGL